LIGPAKFFYYDFFAHPEVSFFAITPSYLA